ncbi:MAG: T9SS type A sorting domain-containing protein, partial [Candidatus Hodarchaeota archaeon]
NVDTTDSFYFNDGANEFIGNYGIKGSSRLERITQSGSDPRDYEAMVIHERETQYTGDMKNPIFPNGLPKSYVHKFYNPETSKTTDTTMVKFVYDPSVGIEDDNQEIPEGFKVYQNYPNPFNPSTKISYSVPEAGFVTLKVYDMLGREITTLVNKEKLPGTYEVPFMGKDLSSGIYFYRIEAGKFSETKKMILLK